MIALASKWFNSGRHGNVLQGVTIGPFCAISSPQGRITTIAPSDASCIELCHNLSRELPFTYVFIAWALLFAFFLVSVLPQTLCHLLLSLEFRAFGPQVSRAFNYCYGLCLWLPIFGFR